MDMSAFYFQGSHLGHLVGLVLIVSVLLWSLCTKVKLIRGFSTGYKWLIALALALVWSQSFINYGHNKSTMPRHQFSSMERMLTGPKIEAVTVDRLTPAQVTEIANKTRKQISEENK